MKKIITVLIAAALAATVLLPGCMVRVKNKENASSQKVDSVASETEAKTEAKTEAPTEAETEAVAKPGQYSEGETFRISFNFAKQYDEIQGDDEYFKATPSKGKKYLVLFFEVENISGKDDHANMFYAKGYVDDYAADSKVLMVEPEGYSMFGGDIGAGKKAKFYVAYEVDPDWKKCEFTYTDGISSTAQKYNFCVTPDQLS